MNIRDSIVAVLNDKGKIIGTGFLMVENPVPACAHVVVQAGAIDGNSIQVDSEVESRFGEMRLNEDDNIIFYFKFPPKFKLDFPRIIGNYNPDWGIARYRRTDDKFLLELVLETKGGVDFDLLRFPHEKRKIECAMKVFQALGVDYRVVSDETADWWESEARQGRMV